MIYRYIHLLHKVGLNLGSSVVPSGILKQVKDHLRECTSCQSRRGAEDGSGTRLYCRVGRHKPKEDEEEEEDHDEEADDSLLYSTSPSSHARLSKAAPKHELVFVSLSSWYSPPPPPHLLPRCRVAPASH